MQRSEWRVKYLVKTAFIAGSDEMAQRDYAAEQARMMARRDVPEALTTVLSVSKTRAGNYSVEVLRKRNIA